MRLKSHKPGMFMVVAVLFVGMAFLGVGALRDSRVSAEDGSSESFVTIYDEGERTIVKSGDVTVREMLSSAKIAIDEKADIIEPSLDTAISGRDFYINIYRARPALAIDGTRTVKLMTASTVPRDVVIAAGIELFPEDVVNITTEGNFQATGIPFAYQVVRAKLVNFNYYGKIITVRTQATTVADLLRERGIALGMDDWLSAPLDTTVAYGLELTLYRNGKSTITLEEEIPYGETITRDYNRELGYRAVITAGTTGKKVVTYEVEMLDGREISRSYISEMITAQSVAQEVTVGAKSIAKNPLTKAMGRNRYTTPDGIVREETYYDLPMNGVMAIKARECGGSTNYTVRADGVKVDDQGYILVAAHLGRYPRCTIVETSLGLGRVYDTGDFAGGNAEQFDIATDWTRPDGI